MRHNHQYRRPSDLVAAVSAGPAVGGTGRAESSPGDCIRSSDGVTAPPAKSRHLTLSGRVSDEAPAARALDAWRSRHLNGEIAGTFGEVHGGHDDEHRQIRRV